MALKTNKITLREDDGWTQAAPTADTVHISVIGVGVVEYAVATAIGDVVEGEYPVLDNTKTREKVFLNLGANLVFVRRKVGTSYLLVTAY